MATQKAVAAALIIVTAVSGCGAAVSSKVATARQAPNTPAAGRPPAAQAQALPTLTPATPSQPMGSVLATFPGKLTALGGGTVVTFIPATGEATDTYNVWQVGSSHTAGQSLNGKAGPVSDFENLQVNDAGDVVVDGLYSHSALAPDSSKVRVTLDPYLQHVLSQGPITPDPTCPSEGTPLDGIANGCLNSVTAYNGDGSTTLTATLKGSPIWSRSFRNDVSILGNRSGRLLLSTSNGAAVLDVTTGKVLTDLPNLSIGNEGAISRGQFAGFSCTDDHQANCTTTVYQGP